MEKIEIQKDLESYIIGSILIEKDAINRIDLNEIYFYIPENKEIIKSIIELNKLNKPIDLIFLYELNNKINVSYLSSLTINIVSTIYLESYFDKLKNLYFNREFLQILNDTRNDILLNDTDFITAASNLDSRIYNLTKGTEISSVSHLKEVLNEVKNEIKKVIDSGCKISGLNTGFDNLNKYTLGLQDSDLIIIAGRPSMGKTAFALQLALNISNENPVLFCSLEMSAKQLGFRTLSNSVDISPMALKQGYNVDFNSILKTIDFIGNKKNLFIDQYSRTIEGIRNKTKRLIKKYGIKAIFIDYLQLMTGKGMNREQEISEISRGLKALAKELNIPIIVLSQLSREVEKRADKKPILSDLRESGSIEQDADLIIFPYREKYYFDNCENDYLELIIKKNRNGALGSIFFEYNDCLTMFKEID